MLYLFIAWHVGKAVYCCAGAVQVVVQVLCVCGGAPYILQVQMCMGLAGALGMHQARPCYWSQTEVIPISFNVLAQYRLAMDHITESFMVTNFMVATRSSTNATGNKISTQFMEHRKV